VLDVGIFTGRAWKERPNRIVEKVKCISSTYLKGIAAGKEIIVEVKGMHGVLKKIAGGFP